LNNFFVYHFSFLLVILCFVVFLFCLPSEKAGGVGKPSAEGRHEQQVAPLQHTGPVHLVERYRDARRRGVAVVFNVDVVFFLGNAHTLGGKIDDPFIGLMWYNVFDVVNRQPVSAEQCLRVAADGVNRIFEGFLTLQMYIRILGRTGPER
jgi:hypothetical protein